MIAAKTDKFIMDLRYFIDFTLAMTEKEIKARYKLAILGFLWIFLNPLLQMLTIGFVFSYFVRVPVDNYFLFLFAGLLPWNFFAYTITKNTSMIVNERSLIQKAKFPRETIIFSIIASNLFHLFVSLVLFAIVLLFFGALSPLRVLALPLAMICLIILTTGVSLLLSALNVRYRDVSFFVSAIVPLWFYATPIVYTLNMVPFQISKIYYLNPMAFIIELFQYSLLGNSFMNLSLGVISLTISLALLLIGVIIFHKESRNFDDWL